MFGSGLKLPRKKEEEKNSFFADFALQSMVETTLPDGLETFGAFLRIFPLFKKIVFLSILGPPYCGISATIRIGPEMLCLPYAGFFS